MKRAALYARVSTDKQSLQATIESQVLELKKQIAHSGDVLVKEYIDDGYSGKKLDRPGLEELRRDAKGDVYDAIYFHSADRLARKAAHQTIIVDELLRSGKQVVIGGKDFVRNPENTLTLTMLGAFAEFEREKIIERTTRGWRHRIRSGGIVSQGNCTFGYDYLPKTTTSPCTVVVNEEEAETVRWIFDAYASGMGVQAITRSLEERGVRTKRGGKLWYDKSIKWLLQNQVYTGIRYYNRMTRAAEPAKGRKHAPLTFRDRSEWVGVPVPAIISQELFDRVQERMQAVGKKYRHPIMHYLLSGLVECGECGCRCSSYRRYMGKQLVSGKRRIYHKAAYKCNSGTSRKMHARENITPCRNPQIATHLLEDAVFDVIQKQMLDPVTLRSGIDALKGVGEQDHDKLAQGLMTIARKIQAAEERKRQLIDLYASGHLAEAAYVNANISLDQELHELKSKKAEFVGGLPLLHKESVDLSIRQFCDIARVRFERCVTFDDKRQFLADYVERVIYDRYRVTVIGSVPIKMQLSNSQEIETRKIAFCLRGEIDKTKLHKTKPRKTFAEDGRMDAFSSGGRKEPVISAPIPVHSLSSLT
jgi:site-specific DNA recombinase